MISLKHRQPPAPAELIVEAAPILVDLNNKFLTGKIVSKDFLDIWGKYKKVFIPYQNNGKCAYCECQVTSGYPGDVEHFRPKTFCQDLGDAENLDDYSDFAPKRKALKKEPGYWWLAYDWNNYLLSCNRCNSSWKKNQFPIEGARSVYGANINKEKALLLNPYFDDPEPHLTYEYYTGQIKGKTNKGKRTVNVCGLQRKGLQTQRALKGRRMIALLDTFNYSCKSNDEELMNKIMYHFLIECRPKETFAGLARFFVKKELDIEYKQLIKIKTEKLI